MKVWELREALAAFDPDTQVIVGDGSAEEWARALGVERGSANLGFTTETVARISIAELPYRETTVEGECAECDRLRDIIDDAKRELDNA